MLQLHNLQCFFLDAAEVGQENGDEGNLMLSMDLPVQSQQWKLQNNG